MASGRNAMKVRRTARKLRCAIDAVLYFGRSHKVFLKMWNAFKEQCIVPQGDMIKQHEMLVNLPHVPYVGNDW